MEMRLAADSKGQRVCRKFAVGRGGAARVSGARSDSRMSSRRGLGFLGSATITMIVVRTSRTSAAPTITLSGQAKTDDCSITGTTLDALATDHGIVEVNPPLHHTLLTCQPHARRSAAATPCSEQLKVP